MKEKREILARPISDGAIIERPFGDRVSMETGRYPGYRDLGAQEGFQFLDYWRAIRRRLWLVVGIAVLVTTLTAIYIARKPNIFMARGIIQVDLEQNNPDLVTSDRQRPIVNPDPSYFNTQLQLLGSETLLRRVLKEHNLDANKEFQKARAEATASTWRSALRSLGLAGDSDSTKTATPDDANPFSDSGLISADEIDEALRLAPYVELLRDNLEINPIRESRATVKDTRLIEISFRNSDPQLAAFVTNAIAETFTNWNQERRSGTSRKTSDFLQQRIAELQAEIKSDEIKLVELKKSEGILKTGEDQTIVLDQLSILNKQLREAENDRKLAEAKYNAVANSPENIKALTEEKMARFITEQENSMRSFRNETQKKISDLRSEKSRMLQIYKERAPEIKEIETQIESLEQSIERAAAVSNDELGEFRVRTAKVLLDNLRTEFLQNKDRESKIRAAYDQVYNEAQGQNTGAVLLKLLEQNIETNKGFLDDLRKQQSSNDIASQGSDNNISIAAFAIPPKIPVSPRRLMTVAAALFLSTFFGIGLALFLEYLDDTISTTEEIEGLLQLPALAVIPSIGPATKRRLLLVGSHPESDENIVNSELLIYADSRSALAEAYRQLRTSILLSTAGHSPKTLLVTSSLMSEGKTTTATNTAICLAQTGASVLIIDADMRRPRLHSVFNCSNEIGLSTLLSGPMDETATMNAIKADQKSGISLLTSGPIPPNPAELIGSEQMANLLGYLQIRFTHVVVDSPPISSFTDGVLIASMVDGVIFVVHSGKSTRQIVRRSKQLLGDVGARILGVVLNNVAANMDNKYYYESYYAAEENIPDVDGR